MTLKYGYVNKYLLKTIKRVLKINLNSDTYFMFSFIYINNRKPKQFFQPN